MAAADEDEVAKRGGRRAHERSILARPPLRLAAPAPRRYNVGMSSRARWLFAAAVLAGLVWVPLAGAEDARDQTVLDGVVKDLGFTLLAKPDDTFVRLPLAPQRWSLFGRMQPYASLSPRALAPAEEVTGLAAPIRETDALSKGVDVGAGVSWHLSDRFELFGEYQLLNMGARNAPTEGPLGRRDLDAPSLKGGFSIRF
jgi:hypothetical protein